ncbi:MAG: gliding motility-associated C-terminal domain-containing protein, partial [Saprospiraceae bacterium]|nr:gliding motility-associated C-terminal domain-containing protein [Saprospiraceae bacterium]
ICQQNLSVSGHGGVIYFTSNVIGGIKLVLDFNSNGIYTDPEDVTYYKNVEQGQDSIIWDGRNGLGEVVPPNTVIPMNYSVNVKGGEIHIILSDIENNPGGVGFTRLNGSNSPSSIFYYDHSLVGGTVSGGGTVPAPTSLPYTYTDNFGNEKYLDYWSYTDYGVLANGTFNIFVAEQCQTELAIDTDHDSIPDIIDLDDDNDGITDKNEFCNPTGGFSCLGLGFDPSGDEDNDKIPNYLDANDPTVQNGCNDDDNNGTCDTILPIYDTDGDNVPDHLDLDSDNDGITDLVESGNLQVDLNGDGIIDGNPSAFGENGLFNLIENNDGQDAVSTYTIIDFDNDGIPDHDDLDADNDGIFDVNEAGFALSDSNNDGRIDDGNGNPPLVSASGLAPIIDPAVTGNPIPYPVDTDHDGVSDWHDHDSDNDGIFDVLEGGNPDIDNDGFIGGGTPTVNANGVATAAGNHPTNVPTDTDGDGTPDYRDLDSDGDGLSDVSEARNPDGDLDWIIDSGNPVVDIFGVSTTSGAQSHPSDLDGDGIPDFRDIDRDGDSVPDAFECETGHPCPDTDHDGLVDADDLDTDNDEMPDALECPDGTCPDYNQNGIREWREYMCNPFTTVPIIQNFTDNITLCEGQNIDLNASNNTTLPLGGPVTYTWRGPNNFEYTSTAPVNGGFPLVIDNVNSSYEGSYVLTVYTTRGCPSAPRSVLVQINDKPAAPNLTALDNNLCENGNLWLNTNAYDGNVVSYQWYFKDTNGDVSNLGTTAVPNFNISNLTQDHEGTYYVSVAVDGCNSNNSNLQPISVVDPISGAIAQSNVEGSACPNELVELNVPVITGATYLWEGPIGFFSEQPNPIISSFSYPNEGTYNVYTYIDGCLVNKSSVNIAVQDSILAADDFINSIEGVASQNINILENDAFGAIGEINIVITVQPKNGTLTLNNDGTVNYTSLDNFIGDDTFSYTICRVDCPNSCAQARVNINVDNNANESIFIPNVITPNGDGKNDNFKILNIEDYPNNKITIYNRYGDVVFTKPGYLNTWNGTWNDQALPAGTYFYYLLLDTNDTNPRTGYITIVR